TLFHSLQIVRIGDSRAIETDVPYAKQHQFGLLGNETRPFLGANEDDVRRMSALIMNKLVGA
ncbi:MAG: hypothetical protein OEX12_16065, partial [Gammaproteobacteria bacterium]|nr:hypothetical protein [Gammaproteobacteria bacterium]